MSRYAIALLYNNNNNNKENCSTAMFHVQLCIQVVRTATSIYTPINITYIDEIDII